MSEALSVVAIIKAKPGSEDTLCEVLEQLVAPTHREAGCMEYVLHRGAEDRGVFVFTEKWKNQEALTEHLASAHVRDALTRAGQYLAEPPAIIPLNRLSREKQRA